MVGSKPGGARRALPLLVILFVLASLVLVLSSLRPDDDQAADEVDAPPTTTPINADSTTTTTIATVQKFTLMIPANGLIEAQEIARSGDRLVALQFEEAENGPPRLLQSPDGQAWTPLVTSLDAASDQRGSVVLRDYESLVATESGFALLMTTLRLEERDFTPRFEVMRLTSPDGTVWTRDPAFETVQGTVVSAPFHHDSESFGLVEQRQSRPIVTALLQQALDNDVAIPSVCGVTRLGPDQIQVEDCDTGELVAIRRADVVDPERFSDLSRCIFALQAHHDGPSTVVIVREGREPFVVPEVPLLTVPPLVVNETTLAAFDEAPQLPEDSGCIGFLELTGRQVPSMVRWSAGVAGPTLFELPPEIARDLPNLRAEPVIDGDRVLFVLDSGAWSMSVATGEWTQLLPLPEGAFAGEPVDVALMPDGSGLIALAVRQIGAITFDEQIWGWAEQNPPLSNPRIQYLDAQTLVVSGDAGAFVISLPLNEEPN